MTKKRYHKLFQAYMTRIMAHNPGAGRVLRAARKSDPLDVYRSYEAAWAALAPYAADYGVRKGVRA